MTLYIDNPNLNLPIKKTVDGTKEYRNNCKYIGEKYYRINDQVYEVEGTWYRKETGKIELDHELQKWQLKNGNLIKGAVGINPDGTPLIGHFSRNPIKNAICHFSNYGRLSILNVDLIQDNSFVENMGSGEFVQTIGMGAGSIAKLNRIHNEVDHTRKGYNIEDNAVEFAEKKQVYAEYNTKISKDAKLFGKLLGDTTFGCELETSEGMLPDYLQYRHGTIICRDGSIHGGAEYVTIPMSGPKGIQTLHNLCNDLSKRCNIDVNCALHIHLGNLPQDRAYLVSLYNLFYKIQDELFKMFPYYKTDPRGVKKKNYCQKSKTMAMAPLKDTSKAGFKEYVDDYYYKLFMFLSDGIPPDAHNNRNNNQHPVRNKWDRVNRLTK